MRAMEGIFQGFRGIFGNKLRSGLTMLGITIGIAAVLAMVSISDGAKDIIVKDLEKMGGGNQFSVFRSPWIEKNGRWQPNTSGQFFTYEDIWALERECPSIQRVVVRDFKPGFRVTAGGGIQSTETRAFTVGTTPNFTEAMDWYAQEGRFVEDEDLFDWTKVVVIGSATADQLFGDADPVGGEIKLNGQRFTVIGVMESRGTSLQFGWNFDEQIVIPHTTAARRFDGNERVNGFFVQTKSVEKIPDAYTEALRVFKRRHGDEEFYRVFTPGQSNMEFILKLSNMLKVVLGGIAGFSLFIGGIGIMNIMFVTVTERTKEIGLRKALGARRFDILLQFLIEASVLCAAGGVMGVALGIGFGWGSAKVISNPLIGGFISPLLGFRGQWVAWPWAVSVPWILISLGVSLAVGLFFGLYPAMKAARLTPIEALRHQ